MSAKTRSRATSASRARPKPVRRRVRWKRVVVLLVFAGVLLFAALAGALYVFADVPGPNDLARAQSARVADHEGHTIGRLHAGADRVTIKLSDIPKDLQNAVIATEDRHFYEHRGIRVTSIMRAALANLIGRGVRQGGSTITQQYVKNAFVGNERSVWRKTREAVLALKLERQRTKTQILAAYLNTIYFGRGAYGCEAAALTYFGKHAKTLTLGQSAMLAGIIQAPETYDPAREPERARGRRDLVLSFLVRDGYVTREQADAAKVAPMRARARTVGGMAPHYLEDVRREVERAIGSRRLYAGGITVRATLDVRMQSAAEEAVRTVYPFGKGPEAALVAIDPASGAVRAMVGARDFGKVQLNLATQGHRRPGSTFKPAVLAAAVAAGVSIDQTFPAPASITVQGRRISNDGQESFGRLDLSRATWLSVNTVYAQLIMKIGASDVVATAKKLGIASRLAPQVGLALGDQPVTPLELASMYATLAARGVRHGPFLVEKVTDRGGRTLYQTTRVSGDGIARADADAVTSVLQGVMTQGTGRSAVIGRPSAGKTGTTDEHVDAWFAGYTPQLAAVVWTGYPNGARPLEGVRGVIRGRTRTVRRVYGGSFPAEMWRLFMRAALDGAPAERFASPAVPSPSPSTGASPSATPSPSASPGSLTPTATPSVPIPTPSATS